MERSRTRSSWGVKLTAIAHRTGTLILFTNQFRHRSGIVFGNPETTTGGNALKFYASVRLEVRRIGAVPPARKAKGVDRVHPRPRRSLPHFSMHDLRRAWASAMHHNGAPLKQVSVWLGHAEVATTERSLRAPARV